MEDKKIKESPEYVRLSLAAAMTLRLESGMFYREAKLYCINLLLTYKEGCSANCSYCGLSRERFGEYEDKSFIRVDWPTYPIKTVIERLKKDYTKHVERVCISMITHKRAIEDTVFIARSIKEAVDLPISLLINPTILNKQNLIEFKEAGADMVGIAVDAATQLIFDENRGKAVKGPHKWDKYWEIIEDASLIFGKNKFGTHLIVGLDEKEEEMIKTIQRVRNLGGRTHLFSFYPEKGSRLADRVSCDVSAYRRVQLARYLIDYDHLSAKDIRFDFEGRVIDYVLDDSKLNEIIATGSPFKTSGCPGKTQEGACNRPFGDGPPSDIRSFPFKPNKNDLKKIRKQMNIPRLSKTKALAEVTKVL